MEYGRILNLICVAPQYSSPGIAHITSQLSVETLVSMFLSGKTQKDLEGGSEY